MVRSCLALFITVLFGGKAGSDSIQSGRAGDGGVGEDDTRHGTRWALGETTAITAEGLHAPHADRARISNGATLGYSSCVWRRQAVPQPADYGTHVQYHMLRVAYPGCRFALPYTPTVLPSYIPYSLPSFICTG
jgi:hypothetical protein